MTLPSSPRAYSNTRTVSPSTSVAGSSAPLTFAVSGAVVEKPSIWFSATRGFDRSSGSAGVPSSFSPSGRSSVPSDIGSGSKNRSFGNGTAPLAGSKAICTGAPASRSASRSAATASKSCSSSPMPQAASASSSVADSEAARARRASGRRRAARRTGTFMGVVIGFAALRQKCQLSWALKMSIPDSYSPRTVIAPGDSAEALSIAVSATKRWA